MKIQNDGNKLKSIESFDGVGQDLIKHVVAMGKLRSVVESLPENICNVDYLSELMYDLDTAHAALYRQLVECSVQATYVETDLRDELEDRDFAIVSLADCLRNGVELIFGSWEKWQSEARRILKENAPVIFKQLRSFKEVVETAKKEGK